MEQRGQAGVFIAILALVVGIVSFRTRKCYRM